MPSYDVRDFENFAHLFRTLRKATGYTRQQDLADVMGSEQSTISNIETGKVTHPQHETLYAAWLAFRRGGLKDSFEWLQAAAEFYAAPPTLNDDRWLRLGRTAATLPPDLHDRVYTAARLLIDAALAAYQAHPDDSA